MSAETSRAADSLSLRLEELGRQVASARTAADQAVADAGQRAIGDVLEAVVHIEEAGDQSAILNTLLEAGGRFASRTAFFLARPGTVRGWGGKGFEAAPLEALQSLSFDYSEESIWTDFIQGRGVVRLGAEDCERLSARFGAKPARKAVLVPFVLRGQLGGALYADQLEDVSEALSESSLQLLTHSAARAIETLPFREHASPTLKVNTIEGTPAPLWRPPTETPSAEVSSEPEVLAETQGTTEIETVIEPEVTVEPDAASPEPEAIAVEPEPVTPEPEAIAVEPEPVTPEPETVTAEPEAIAVDPEPVTEEPALVAEEPATATAEPEAIAVDPKTVAEEPVDLAEPTLETISPDVEVGAHSEPENLEVPEIEPALPEIDSAPVATFEAVDAPVEEHPSAAPQTELPEASPAFEATAPTLEATAPAEDSAFATEDSAFAVEDSELLPIEELPVAEPPSFEEQSPAFESQPSLEAEAIRMPDEPTLEELSGDITPEPELEDTSTGIWSLEEDDEDDEPTAVGQVAAQAPAPTPEAPAPEAPAPASVPVSPEPADLALGQQTVRLDIAALQGQIATGGAPVSAPPPAAPSLTTAAAPAPPQPVAPAVEEPPLPDPVPVDSPLTAPPAASPDELPTLVSPAPPAPEPSTQSAGFDAPSQEAYVPPPQEAYVPPPAAEPVAEPPPPSSFVPPPSTEVEPPPPAKPSESSETSQVLPPDDLEGPGLAFSSSPSRTADAEDALHEEARRLARLLVSEIKLYNEEIIEEGRRSSDIYGRLKDDIDRSRQMYEERIDPRIRGLEDYFHQELVQRLAGGDASLLGL